jgi:hypothetical protein
MAAVRDVPILVACRVFSQALVIALIILCGRAAADDGVSVPWEEFKRVYHEYVAREIQKEAAALQKARQVYSIDEARYTLNVNADYAQGEVHLTGKVISGEPEPIPLFGPEIVITAVTDATGGTVVCGAEEGRAAFLAEGTGQEFQLAVSFFAKPKKESGMWALSFPIPRALRNSLDLRLPPGAQIVEAPGVAAAEGRYHFPASSCLSIKYIDREEAARAGVIEVDTFSRIRVQENRIGVITSFLPSRALPPSIILTGPEGAAYVCSSLDASRITALDSNRHEFRLLPGEQGLFSVEWALDMPEPTGKISLSLPRIEGNNGQQGRFILEEPDDAQVTATAEGLVSQIPIERLGPILTADARDARYFMKVPGEEKISVAIKRFEAAAAPAVVLDCQYLFSSFEENGNILSVLVMDLPLEIGTRMSLKAVRDAEIWSLKVNEKSEAVYVGEEDVWIIPLSGGATSHVELAFLRKSAKLGLQGRLDVLVPQTGLASREVRVGVAVPERVELLSVEGPVSAASGEGWELPAEFSGKTHFFSRSFHKGEEMTVSVAYKEPVNRPQ